MKEAQSPSSPAWAWLNLRVPISQAPGDHEDPWAPSLWSVVIVFWVFFFFQTHWSMGYNLSSRSKTSRNGPGLCWAGEYCSTLHRIWGMVGCSPPGEGSRGLGQCHPKGKTNSLIDKHWDAERSPQKGWQWWRDTSGTTTQIQREAHMVRDTRAHTHTHTHTHKCQTHHDYSDRHTDAHISHQHTYTFILTCANTPHTNTHGHTDTHSLKHMHKEPPDSGSGLPRWLETRPPAPGSQPPPHPLEGRFDHGPIPSRLKDLESPFCLGSSPNRTVSWGWIHCLPEGSQKAGPCPGQWHSHVWRPEQPSHQGNFSLCFPTKHVSFLVHHQIKLPFLCIRYCHSSPSLEGSQVGKSPGLRDWSCKTEFEPYVEDLNGLR